MKTKIKKIGVTSGALIIIILLLGLASITNTSSFIQKRTGLQIIAPWDPAPGIFGQQKSITFPSAGQAGMLPQTETPGVIKTPEEQALTPKDVQYYIQGIIIPSIMAGEIQLFDDVMRTYEGKFGPYPYNPVESLVIKICSQNQYESDPPTCEQIISTAFINDYVIFGYANKHDEYIGYYPRRQYSSYFEVYTKDGKLLDKSNVGKVRLVFSD